MTPLKIVSTCKYNAIFQYFFSDPTSKLPIRDVNNLCKQGIKTEPHLEIGAENFIKECTQSKITNAIKEHLDYIFLITKCRCKDLKEFFNKQFIIGYINIQETILRETTSGKKFFAIRGDSKVVSYEDAISVPNFFGKNLNRGDLNKKIEATEANELKKYLDTKKDITQKWIDEIEKVDVGNKTCLGKTQCPFGDLCRRK